MSEFQSSVSQDGLPLNEKKVTRKGSPSFRARNIRLFMGLFAVWLAFDIATKNWFSSNCVLGEVAVESLFGVVQFRLVHNTGAAWGVFGDSTLALGVFSLILCILLTVYFAVISKRASLLETLGLALVVSGGFGNMLDRFILGYVVDFIDPLFIDFPVFNIADIGVTCGFVVFVVGLILRERREFKGPLERKGVEE